MATSPLSLPVELLHDIVLNLDRDSLISLAQSCRVLHAVAVQQLHRNVPRLSGPNTIRCLNTLATAPEIAGKVRTFNIYSSFFVGLFTTALPQAPVRPSGKDVWNRLLALFRPSPPPLSPPPPLAPPRLHFIAGIERISLQTTANAFYNMKNLHTLIIHAPSHPKLWEFEHPIPTLRTIFVHHNAESPSLFAWIMTQQSITYLRMNDIFPAPLPIAKWYSLPNLRYLICNPLGVFHLFPGGRVSELIIEDLFDSSVVDHLATVIASSSANSGTQLQRLTVYGRKVAIDHLLNRLGQLLPHLLFLRIFMVDKPWESERVFFDQFLPKFTCLETLEFFAEVPTPWHTSPPIKAAGLGVAGEEAIVKHWAEVCPRLHVVRLQSHSKWCIRRSREGNKVEMEYPFSPTDNLKVVY